ncbi:hypothetical protein LGN19_24170 [Burkholderia sp. AU30198]|uniref:hypothetical protein n=1 Tax=Burkholderia sp. AU30198 TaxID=2879627 RepID=UPI001CF14641|nr:hypothetical protein [Burkholderia sp. AU30198]MCA8296893.1 hypothetical protein [Burkholderia sp. AU30198]
MTLTIPPQPQSTVTDGEADVQRFIDQLDALQPSKLQQKALLFQKAYLAIERAIAREVPQKQIVAELDSLGLSLSIGGFRSLLEVERKQRKESGGRVRCERCGSSLPHEAEEENGS